MKLSLSLNNAKFKCLNIIKMCALCMSTYHLPSKNCQISVILIHNLPTARKRNFRGTGWSCPSLEYI